MAPLWCRDLDIRAVGRCDERLIGRDFICGSVAAIRISVECMEYRSLGRTGMQVSPLCLGAMMFGAWGEPDHDTSIKIIHTALDAGINFIDTADVYSQGESEIIVGKALANGKRDDVVLATKFHGQMGVPATAPMGTKATRTTRQFAPLDRPGGREQPAPAEHRLDRPLSVHRPTRTPTSRRP